MRNRTRTPPESQYRGVSQLGTQGDSQKEKGRRSKKNKGCRSGQLIIWEVLSGVGVDGVGGIFQFFSLFFCFSSLFFAFLGLAWMVSEGFSPFF